MMLHKAYIRQGRQGLVPYGYGRGLSGVDGVATPAQIERAQNNYSAIGRSLSCQSFRTSLPFVDPATGLDYYDQTQCTLDGGNYFIDPVSASMMSPAQLQAEWDSEHGNYDIQTPQGVVQQSTGFTPSTTPALLSTIAAGNAPISQVYAPPVVAPASTATPVTQVPAPTTSGAATGTPTPSTQTQAVVPASAINATGTTSTQDLTSMFSGLVGKAEGMSSTTWLILGAAAVGAFFLFKGK